jgi:hypothetical protein
MTADLRGCALPPLRTSHLEWDLYRSLNNRREGPRRPPRSLVPRRAPVILPADRGFGRTELVRTCRALGLRCLVRVKPDVWVRRASYQGKACQGNAELPGAEGRAVAAARRALPQGGPVVRWAPGLPRKRYERRTVVTDLCQTALRLTGAYGQRTTDKRLFRDGKIRRYGLGLGGTQLNKAGRFDRLLLVLHHRPSR